MTRMKRRGSALIFMLAIILCWTALSEAAHYTYTYSFPTPQLKDMGDGTVFPELKGCWPKTAPVGAPVLPRKTAKLFIPPAEEVESITVDGQPAVFLPGIYEVTPAPKPVPLSMSHLAQPPVQAKSIYGIDGPYPGVDFVDLGIQKLMGTSLVVLQLCPVQYNPVSGRIAYYRTMTVTVTTRRGLAATTPMFRNRPSDRAAIVSVIDNKEAFLKTVDRAPRAVAAGERQYLIITTRALKDTLQKLADYRASQGGGGFNTHIALVEDIDVTVSGQDLAQKIRFYIRDSYQNHGTQYVVLGGDAHGAPKDQTLPTRGCVASAGGTLDTNIPTDLYFGCLDGPWDGNENGIWGEVVDGTEGGDIDWHSEVYVGRINADTPERALAQINKIMAYETSGKSYKSLMVGEVLDDNPTYGGDKLDWVATFMPDMPKSTLYDRDQSEKDWSADVLVGRINSDDIVWINHLGHSWVQINMKLTEDYIADLTNSRFYFIYTQGCYPGSMDNREQLGIYSYEDSIIENMVMARDKGPFAAVANSRYGWYLPGKVFETGSNRLHAYFVQQVVQGVRSLGKANQRSKTNLDLDYSVNRWIAFETNLFGDPASELPAPSVPDSPTLVVTVEGKTVAFSWNRVLNASGYTLYYAPSPYTGPDSIQRVDVGDKTRISSELDSSVSFFVAVKAYNRFGSSGYSNIERFVIP
ncbi:MAG: hypothetical protein K9L83_07680 [Deltaproteobacteria bacterium]|nr:hypothetical protein [Deltaproteobacteria bacterium]